jgi:hypothetical protein
MPSYCVKKGDEALLSAVVTAGAWKQTYKKLPIKVVAETAGDHL